MGLAEIREVGQIIRMWADAITGYGAIGRKVERDIDHVILEPPPVQVSSCARVIEGQDVGQQDSGNRQRLSRRVCTLRTTRRQRLKLLLEDRQKHLASRRRHRAHHVPLIGGLGHVERVLVAAVVEHGIDGWPTHLVGLHQAIWLKRHWYPRSSPDANLRI